jgi:hypothetical protein
MANFRNLKLKCESRNPCHCVIHIKGQMEEHSSSVAAAGRAIEPLRNLDDVAVFAEASSVAPEGLRDRARRVAQHMQSAGVDCTEVQAGKLMTRAKQWQAWGRLLQKLSPFRRATLVYSGDSCVACSANVFEQAVPRDACRPTVFTESGAWKGEMPFRKCTGCGARHYVSYSTGGRILADKQLFYSGVADRQWFHVTEHTCFETRVLQRLSVQMLHSHTGWETFAHEYWSLTGSMMDRRLLSHAWLAISFLLELEENRLPLVPFALSSTAACDATLLDWQERLRGLFITSFGQNHAAMCRFKETCGGKVMAADGHMKCRRPCCPNPFARSLDLGDLGIHAIPCSHDPTSSSIYCGLCEDASVRPGPPAPEPQGNAVSSDESDADGEDGNISSRTRQSQHAAATAGLTAGEYLVEKLLDRRTLTRGNCQSGHQNCLKRKSTKYQYKVRWVGFSESDDSWECECGIRSCLLDEYEGRGSGTHSGHTAAQVGAKQSGDFVMSEAERKELFGGDCSGTLKEKQTKGLPVMADEKHVNTAGTVHLVAACGQFLAAKEIYRTESLLQARA